MKALYDQIGEGYDTTRRADPGILDDLTTLLDIQIGKHYLDVALCHGCASRVSPSNKQLHVPRKTHQDMQHNLRA